MDTPTMIILISILLSNIAIWSIVTYTIHRDTKSKEKMFEIQMVSAGTRQIRDATSTKELYDVLEHVIAFYVSRKLTTTNLVIKTDKELSLMLDELVVSVSTEVELHLSDTFKKEWEVWFNAYDETIGVPTHLQVYISTNVRTLLIGAIEKMKITKHQNDVIEKKKDL